MNEMSVGIIACASMHEQIKECVVSLKGSFKIYPLIPPCTFSMKIDLIRYYLDKSIMENNVTLLAYGICHPQMLALLTEYGDRVVRLKGNNCFEMFLDHEKYSEYHRKCYWILNKPFFTKYRKELLAGFEAGTKNGRMLIGETYKGLVYLKFENDQLDTYLVEDFADVVGLEYEVHSADTANLKRLLEEALASASPVSHVKRLEPSLKYPEESEVRTILENIGEIIYRIDVHTKAFTFISSQTETILGYTREEFIKIMNDYVQVPFYHEDDKEQVIAKRYNFLVNCLNERLQEPYEVEYRVNHKNGNTLWVRESIYPCYSPEGIVESFVGKIADITERKLTEEALKKSEEHMRATLNALPDLLFEVDFQGRIYDYHSSTPKLLGVLSEELRGKTVWQIVPREAAVITMEAIGQAFKQGRSGAIYTVEMPTGTHWFELSLAVKGDPKTSERRVIVLARDITKRKQAEEDLRTSENRLAMAVKASSAGIYDHAVPPGAEYYRSPRWAEILGYKLEELPPPEEHVQWVREQIHPDDFAGLEKAYIDFIEGHTSKCDIEVRMKHKSGKWVHVHSISKATERDENGKVTHITGVMVDITDRKKAEEKIKASLKEKEVLLQEIHHRVKNNMQVVSSLLSLQSERIKDSQYTEMFKESQNRIRSMALVHEKLYQSENLAEINVNEYITSLVHRLFRSYEVRTDRVAVTIEVEDISLGINAAVPCGLIINELVSNSLKHAFPDKRKGGIKIKLCSVNGNVELTVADNGVGMPEDFDFRTTDSLGLDLVCTLAEYQLDGEITVDRSEGTAFTITFKEVK